MRTVAVRAIAVLALAPAAAGAEPEARNAFYSELTLSVAAVRDVTENSGVRTAITYNPRFTAGIALLRRGGALRGGGVIGIRPDGAELGLEALGEMSVGGEAAVGLRGSCTTGQGLISSEQGIQLSFGLRYRRGTVVAGLEAIHVFYDGVGGHLDGIVLTGGIGLTGRRAAIMSGVIAGVAVLATVVLFVAVGIASQKQIN